MLKQRPSAPRRLAWFPLGLIVAVAPTLCVGGPVWASPLAAQGVTQRTPNIEDGWTVRPGVLQFNFLHRFTVSDPPARKVSNFPTFNLATGLSSTLVVGVKYATNSTVFTGIPNEYEFWLRNVFLRQSEGTPLDAAVTGAYNLAAQSGDAELTLGRTFGPLRLLGAFRGMSSAYDTERALPGVGGGTVLRVNRWLGLAGDVFQVMGEDEDGEGFEPAWGAGVQIGIPYTPHTLSLQVANTNTGTIQGSSRGTTDGVRFGFEFTIPITLARYFGSKTPAPAPEPEPAPAVQPTPEGEEAPPPEGQPAPGVKPAPAPERPAAPARQPARTGETVAEVRISNFAFGTPELKVKAGTRVRWINGDQVEHSVTAEGGTFDSNLISPGKNFERLFDKAGSFAYFCKPHPFMKGQVVVE